MTAMPQSLAKLHIHLVFSTKQRNPMLHDRIRDALHRYLAAVLQGMGCLPVSINSVEDHVHILFELGRTVSISAVVEEVKKRSSKWLKSQGSDFEFFQWQAGYGAFAISASDVEAARAYIAGQREHHTQQGFPAEYRQMLAQHGVPFDERYVWE